MRYKNKSFSAPVCEREITDEQYQIAVGLRCPECKRLTEECKCQQPEKKREG